MDKEVKAVQEKLFKILYERLALENYDIKLTENMVLSKDLRTDWDSLDLVEIVIDVEQAFGIKIPDENFFVTLPKKPLIDAPLSEWVKVIIEQIKEQSVNKRPPVEMTQKRNNRFLNQARETMASFIAKIQEKLKTATR